MKAGKLLRAWWTGRNGDTPGEPGNACRPPCISPAKRQRERDNVDYFVIDNNSLRVLLVPACRLRGRSVTADQSLTFGDFIERTGAGMAKSSTRSRQTLRT